jgi:hypothetical protein
MVKIGFPMLNLKNRIMSLYLTYNQMPGIFFHLINFFIKDFFSMQRRYRVNLNYSVN